MNSSCSRRDFMVAASAASLGALTSPISSANVSTEASRRPDFRPNYMLASCMYGYSSLEDILPEVGKIGAHAIDIWPRVHGNQREQMDELGLDRFGELLAEHDVELGCLTQYKLGPFDLQEEMNVANRFGCETIVTGSKGPRGLAGAELKSAIEAFVEQMKPHLEVAEENEVVIAIENHGNSLIQSPDSIQWLIDLSPSDSLAVALAPYHLPQDEELIANLIRELGNRIRVFYAWQYGKGCMQAQPKEDELLQMPGRGELDFGPLIEAMAEIRFAGWIEIFMHPFPRGIPILDTTEAVTAEINRSRAYLSEFLVD